MKKGCSIIFLCAVLASSVLEAAKDDVEFLRIVPSDSVVTADFRVRDIFADDLLKRLRKGMTAALEYQVQLWEKRPGWADRLICEKYTRVKITHDPWLKKYLLYTGSDAVEQLREDSLTARCTEMRNIRLALRPEESGDPPADCYLAVRVVVRPMSMDNVEEIRRWLAGEAREFDPGSIRLKERPGSKAGNWIVKLFLNITGFGDRVISAKSELFQLRARSA